ncbi:Cysteine-rich hydrophobic domain-containing protein [Schistosoma japonicum]|uniref:Cysteine-rich hydrophobic domain-containing protein n=2 Tax=Schistosoma japonicum TaxID=6182 RepID=Q5D9N8_SCHJA|nr:SJCHGC02102 protein [Schistosoma japonicum]TNN14629.1 Cysteine-rich hydrophobic domain-containing protein [Schistosoma japonicum]
MNDTDEIDFLNYVSSGQCERPREPVLIKGCGDVTIFGMNNKFKEDFPNELHGKLAPEEFEESIRKINDRLESSLPNHVRWFVCGLLCCCCTAGCSLWPVIHLSRRTKRDLQKILEAENIRLYCNIGLRLSLVKQRSSETTTLMEYVLRIDQIPKACIYFPD